MQTNLKISKRKNKDQFQFHESSPAVYMTGRGGEGGLGRTKTRVTLEIINGVSSQTKSSELEKHNNKLFSTAAVIGEL